jgi:XTP/dITP diphosphohydrolase
MRGQRVVLATGNPGKLRQFSELLGPSGLALVRQSDFGIEPPPETGSTFLENSLLKARIAARFTGLPAIADDSGIEVDALDGRPGLFSARYAGEDASDEQNLRKMLLELENVPPPKRTARYRSIIVFLTSADDPAPLIGEGVWEGAIATAPRGTGCF